MTTCQMKREQQSSNTVVSRATGLHTEGMLALYILAVMPRCLEAEEVLQVCTR